MEFVPGDAVSLAQRLHLARHLVDAFGHMYPAWTQAEAAQELGNAEGLPRSLIAIEGHHAIGCAALLADDEVPGLEHMTPWLGNLWVDEARRNEGIGRRLVESIIDLAAASNARQLHLVTQGSSTWYARMGWLPISTVLLHGNTLHVMQRQLS